MSPAERLAASGRWIGFDIHGLATMGVARGAPTAPILDAMFSPFRADGLVRYDLVVSDRLEPWPGGTAAEADGAVFHYSRDSVCLASPCVQVRRDGDGLRLSGTAELLEYVLALLDRILVARDAAMVHAMTVDYRGHGLCVAAPSGGGKTSTMAKLVERAGFSFMGDDWAFLSRKGMVLGYQRPMFIRPYHRRMYPHLFQGPRKPLVPERLAAAMFRLTRLVQPFVVQHPRLARVARRWSPEHRMVVPREALPGVPMSTSAPLTACIVVERSDGEGPPRLVEEDSAVVAERIVRAFHTSLPATYRAMVAALDASGLAGVEDGLAEKTAVVRDALAGKPTFLLRVPRSLPADRVGDVIAEQARWVLATAGVA